MADLSKPGDSGDISWVRRTPSQPAGPLPPPPQPGWARIPLGGSIVESSGGAPGGAALGGVAGTGTFGYGFGYAGQPPFAKPSTNLLGAILATLFCCLPVGIVAIIFAAQVDTKWNAGDWYGAKESSRKAQMWANISLGLGLLVVLGYVAMLAVAGGSGSGY